MIVEPGIEPGGVKEHERHERTRRRCAEIGMRAEHVTKVRGILAEIGADGRFAFRAAIAFIEDEVENLVHDIEPLDQLGALGGLEPHAMVDQVERGALKALLDRLFRNQERRAISEMPKPQRAFKVRAIWFSRASDG